jgi:hypothetical protein
MNINEGEKTTMKNSGEKTSGFVQLAPAITWVLVITLLLTHILSQGLDLILVLGMLDCAIG